MGLVLYVIHGCTAPSQGPLRVCNKNPRYFATENGTAILLTGSHTWHNLVDMGLSDPPSPFDFDAYLTWMQKYNHNFIRLWAWESTKWNTATTNPGNWGRDTEILVVSPHPWARTGPGTALDGKPKFDLATFDDTYFDRLRSRIEAAEKYGIYVSIMLFEGWCLQFTPGGYENHPFNPANNIQALGGNIQGDSLALSIHELADDRITTIQERYVKQVIDLVNDLDNVLFEISNENHAASTEWQYHMIDFIHAYEKTKLKQHPVGMTFQYKGGKNEDLFSSPADWISPNPEGGYRDDPPPADGSKIIINDTDHLWGIGGTSDWVWKSFCRGLNPIFMDPYDGVVLGKPFDEEFNPIRTSLGQIQQFAQRIDLAGTLPDSSLASSGYCLANVGKEYLIYLADTNQVTVDLSRTKGSIQVEWFNPSTAETVYDEEREAGSSQNFRSPFAEKGVVLFIQN
ncbi:MAG: hypothetical protein HKN76_07990 [Saprospiraceae bacterium]|nr:hypothetical protein [Saprospiraceae bacterium]